MIAYILAGLAVWRISVLLVEEQGPWHLAAKLRWYAGIESTLDGTKIARGFFAELLMCVWCTSFWASIPATVLLWPDDWRMWLMLPWALSGASVLIEVFRPRR